MRETERKKERERKRRGQERQKERELTYYELYTLNKNLSTHIVLLTIGTMLFSSRTYLPELLSNLSKF
jgi:hypothetical protein